MDRTHPDLTEYTDFCDEVDRQVAEAFGVPRRLTLPADSAERKNYPLYAGAWRYFPAALAGVAKHSKAGNDKHNPGEPMHHARGKSMDHEDCILRHLMDLADLEMSEDSLAARKRAILDEANAIAWRALALSQELHEIYGGAPLAPGARSISSAHPV